MRLLGQIKLATAQCGHGLEFHLIAQLLAVVATLGCGCGPASIHPVLHGRAFFLVRVLMARAAA
jgi:hypothetical protein